MARVLSGVVILLLCEFLARTTVVFADTPLFRVQPEQFSLSIAKGTKQENVLIFRNDSDYDLQVSLLLKELRDFGEEVPMIPGKGSAVSIPRGWIQFNEGVQTIPARTSKQIPFTIRLPEEAAQQDYVAGLVFSVETERLVIERGVTVLLDVFDNGGERIRLESWRAAPFLQTRKARFSYVVANTGSSFAKPHGMVTIRGFDNRVLKQLPIRTETILSGKTVEREIHADLPSGYYRADLELHYANNVKTTTAQTSVVVIPLHVIGAVILILVSSFLVFWRWKRQ